MRIKLHSILVDDQDKALAFYTEKLGFQKKAEYPAGEFKWLTVASPEEPDGPELHLEPNASPVAKAYQQGLRDQGTPAAMFYVSDIEAEYDRLSKLGVKFTLMAEVRIVSADEWEQVVADAERDPSRLRDAGPHDEKA